jgi:hypothetical protein
VIRKRQRPGRKPEPVVQTTAARAKARAGSHGAIAVRKAETPGGPGVCALFRFRYMCCKVLVRTGYRPTSRGRRELFFGPIPDAPVRAGRENESFSVRHPLFPSCSRSALCFLQRAGTALATTRATHPCSHRPNPTSAARRVSRARLVANDALSNSSPIARNAHCEEAARLRKVCALHPGSRAEMIQKNYAAKQRTRRFPLTRCQRDFRSE